MYKSEMFFLILKLKFQAKRLAKLFNLPEKFGYDLLAISIYQHLNFDELCDLILNLDYSSDDFYLPQYEKLKYLFISEIEDQELIDDLHKAIEGMALRLEERTIINVAKLHTISNIYKLFNLENESKYLINAEHIDLNWQPCFDSLQDQQSVLSSDLLINDIAFRLVATRVLDELSFDNLKQSLKADLVQIDTPSLKNNDEKSQINKHLDWLVDSAHCLSNIESSTVDERPHFFKINNHNYLVYGFPLSPYLSISANDKCKNIKVYMKDTKEKQVFIIKIGSEKLILDCTFLHKTEEVEKCYSPKNQWINDTILSRNDACKFPIVFNNSHHFVLLRPHSNVDFIENSL